MVMTNEEFKECVRKNDHSWYDGCLFKSHSGRLVEIRIIHYECDRFEFRDIPSVDCVRDGIVWKEAGLSISGFVHEFDYHYVDVRNQKISEVSRNFRKMRKAL